MSGSTPEVVIDGVRYVPATAVSPDAVRMTRLLVESYWGSVESDERLAELSRELGVYIDDERNSPNWTIEALVAQIFGGGS